MQTPFFSIIIPIYKIREDYLNTCIESIRSQSYKNIEIILVDDGSPDNCGELCDKYASVDTRINVIHQANKGVSAARNTGIEAAKGEWIMFVDADDWIEEGFYDKLTDYLNQSEYDILMFRLTRTYLNKTIELKYDLISSKIYNTQNISDKEYLYRLCMRPPKPGYSVVYYSVDKVYNRNFLIKNNLRYPIGLSKSEDKVFIINCFEKLNKLYYIDESFYYYRINSDSVCNKYSDTADRDRIQLANILLPIANKLDTEIGHLKDDRNYSKITDDCNRFLFGIISDVFSYNGLSSSWTEEESYIGGIISFVLISVV